MNEKFESEASEFAELIYNQVEFKERISNEGDVNLFRKFEKRSSSSHGEGPNNCVLAHCRCNNAAENFDRNVFTDVVPKLCSTRPLSEFPCFESHGISSCMCGAHCWPDSESETETILASDSSSESPRPP